MTICHGCSEPLEIGAQVRTYHTSCDPHGRVEMLERALAPFAAFGTEEIWRNTAWEHQTDESAALYDHKSGKQITKADFKAARAALAYRPAQMKGREG